MVTTSMTRIVLSFIFLACVLIDHSYSQTPAALEQPRGAGPTLNPDSEDSPRGSYHRKVMRYDEKRVFHDPQNKLVGKTIKNLEHKTKDIETDSDELGRILDGTHFNSDEKFSFSDDANTILEKVNIPARLPAAEDEPDQAPHVIDTISAEDTEDLARGGTKDFNELQHDDSDRKNWANEDDYENIDPFAASYEVSRGYSRKHHTNQKSGGQVEWQKYNHKNSTEVIEGDIYGKLKFKPLEHLGKRYCCFVVK